MSEVVDCRHLRVGAWREAEEFSDRVARDVGVGAGGEGLFEFFAEGHDGDADDAGGEAIGEGGGERERVQRAAGNGGAAGHGEVGCGNVGLVVGE